MNRALRPYRLEIATAERLARSAGIDASVTAVGLLGEGVKGLVWQLGFDAREPLALKIYTREGAVLREHAGYAAREGLKLAMPRMLGGELTGESTPHGWTLMTLSPGEPMNASLAVLPRARLLEIYEHAGRQLRKMHEHSCPTFSRVVDADNGFSDNVSRFHELTRVGIEGFLAAGGNRYLASKIHARLHEFDEALANCEVAGFCHGDLHPENIRVSPAGADARFVGSLDLEESIAADPAQDIVRTLHTCPSPGEDVRAALLSGYGDPPPWLDSVLPAYHLYYELELWNYFAAGGSSRTLAPIARRMATQSGASRLRMARSRSRRVIWRAS
jgi:aminoglycoside phosphotransferase (APT) family kinase protein